MNERLNCRLCYDDLTDKNGLLLYDYNENVETKLGRKLNIILNSTEKYGTLSNVCCEYCSSKIEICFSLFVDIKASDEVIQQTYEFLSNDKNSEFDSASQLFMCLECSTTISGIKLFIKHHENHVLKKTTSGSGKDVPISLLKLEKLVENAPVNCNSSISSNENSIESDQWGNASPNQLLPKNCKKINKLNENLVNGKQPLDYHIGGDEEEHELYFSDLNFSGDEISDSYDKLTDSDSLDNFSETETNGICDNSDIDSEVSVSSDSNFTELVKIVQEELKKTDDESDEFKVEPDNDEKYCCEECKISFDYKFLLCLHLKENHSAYHEFDSKNQNEHQENGKKFTKWYYCKFCKGIFVKSEFKDHLIACREQNFHENTLCQICGKMCSFKNLKKHVEEHKKLDKWACELCGKTFKTKRFLKSHLGEHDESKKKICEICGKKLLPLSFLSHIMKHREKRYVCQYCGKAFSYSYGLRIHLKVHDTNKNLTELKPEKKKDKVFCWLCKDDFSCTETLNKHLKEYHHADGVGQDSRFPCSLCEKKFADMFSLKAHLKLIHEMKDEEIARLKSLPVYRYIECNVCNKVFNSENKIRIHMKQDHGLKPFEMEILKKECEKCGKKFASKQNLIHHINGAHLHIKPMTCDICQEKFAKHSSLIYHKLRHSGEKPFQCEFCHKSYRQRNDVIRHLARHVRDKELTLEEASAVNNSPSRLVIKRRIFLKDSSINYQTIVRKNRRKSELIEMEPILEEEENVIQEEQMEFNEHGIPDSMIYVEEVPVDENEPSPTEIHYIDAKPVYNEERNTIILSNPDGLKSSVNNISCKYIPPQVTHVPAVIVKKQEQIFQ